MTEVRTHGDELDTRIVRSSVWAVLGFGGSHGLYLLTTVVLARILVPADFGLIALTLAILSVAYIAQESGLFAALIVHRGDLRTAAACVLVASPLIATGLYLVCFAFAPLLADVFDEPRLTDVFRVTAIVLVIRGAEMMASALLQRELRFRALTAIELAGGVAQSTTAIALALSGAGVWSLVGGQIAASLAQLIVAWIASPFIPSPFEARRATLREMLRFGRHVGAANMIGYLNRSSEELIVGKVLGTATLGYFTIAKRMASLPVVVVGNILGRGVFAALAKLRDDQPAFKRVWLENLQRLSLLAIPVTIGAFLLAEPIILTLFGTDWQPAVVPMQILALNGIVRPFAGTSDEVFQALGHPKLRVYAESIHLALIAPGLLIGARVGGIEGACLAIVLVNAAVGIPVLWVITRLLAVSRAELARSILPPAVGWLMLVTTLLALRPIVDGHPAALQLLLLVAAGIVSYAIGVALFARSIVVTMWASYRGARTSG